MTTTTPTTLPEVERYWRLFDSFETLLLQPKQQQPATIPNSAISSIVIETYKRRLTHKKEYYEIYRLSIIRILQKVWTSQTIINDDPERLLQAAAHAYGQIRYTIYWASKFYYLEKKNEEHIFYSFAIQEVKKKIVTEGAQTWSLLKSALLQVIKQRRISRKISENQAVTSLLELLQAFSSKQTTLQRNQFTNELNFVPLQFDEAEFKSLFYQEFIKQANQYYSSWPKEDVILYVQRAASSLDYEQEFLFANIYLLQRATMNILEDIIIAKQMDFLVNHPTGFAARLRTTGQDIIPIFNIVKRLEQQKIITKKGEKKKKKATAATDSQQTQEQVHPCMQLLINSYKQFLDEVISTPLVIKATQTPDHRFLHEKNYALSMQPVSLKTLLQHLALSFDNPTQVENLIFLLNWYKDKDIFFEKYKYQLALRLLSNKEVEHVERAIRMEYGGISGISMMTQAQRWEQINRDFVSQTSRAIINVKTLKTSAWPNFPVLKTPLSEPFTSILAEYEIYYRKYQPSSYLKLTTLGNVILNLSPNQLVVNQQQAIFLLGFNSTTHIVKESFKFYDPLSIKGLLMSKLVLETEWGYKLNPEWKQKKVRVSMILKQKEKSAEDEKMDQLGRATVLQSVIIKVMKSRNMLEFQPLAVEARKIVRLFEPEPKMIKEVVESLIQRAYLKRDQTNPRMLIYIP